MRMKWNTVLDMAGIGFGYTNHQKRLREALIRQGVEFDDDAEISVSIVPAGNFVPEEGKFNILYTMYETTEIPKSWIPKVKQPDLIVVPCRHNKNLFRNYTKVPIEVCWEGVEVDKFTYKERKFSQPFTFLWFGASNERKGYKHMVVAWTLFRNTYPELIDKTRLIMKTTQNTEHAERIVGFKDGAAIKQDLPCERVVMIENAIFDSRKLPVISENKGDGLIDMYHAAHCFVFPTMGEGFGLTLAEAMATGLPCIYTPWSGPVDFISNKEGYPIKWHFTKTTAMTPQEDGSWKVDLHTKAASPEPKDIVRVMKGIYDDYEEALARGKRAAERIRKYITWDISAQSFIDIVKRHKGNYDQRRIRQSA